jgi:hypothetical protein
MDKFVQENTKRPYVKRVVVSLVLNHLGRHVLKCSAECISLLRVVRLYTPAEITDFNDVTLLDQDVLWFYISVDQSLLMHVIDSTADLDEEIESGVLTQELLFSDQVEQVAFTGVLESQHNSSLVLKTGVEPTNVLVV